MNPFAINQFMGMLPKVSAKLISDNHAQVATNCKVGSGRLVPFQAHSEIQSIAQGSTPQTIYDLDGTWLSWDVDVDVEPSLLSDIYEEMVEQYATGGSTTTLVDTKINFVSAGIEPGMTIKNLTNATEETIANITTTLNPNDTLVFPATTLTSAGDLYQVVNEETVDHRFYYTGDGVPKQSNKTLALPVPAFSGPTVEYNLGLKKPATILSVALGGAPTGTVLKTVSYTYTLVNLFGEESEPSTSTDIVSIEDGHTITLSNVMVPISALEGIEYVRIYRSVTGTTTAQYQLVEQLPASDFPNVSATYLDTVSDDLLGITLSSQNYKAPVDGMIGLTKFNNSVYAGFYKNSVYLSEPNKPHAWPHAIDLPDEVVSIASYDNQLIVGTKGTPFVISGEDPLYVSVVPLPVKRPCYFKRGMVSTPLGVLYVCAEGIQRIINASKHDVLTSEILDRDFFPTGSPVSLTYFDEKLFIMSDTDSTGYYLDPQNPVQGIFNIDAGDSFVFSGWVEKDSDLYMVGNLASVYTIRGWEQDAAALQLTWKSKKISHRFSGNYQVGKVIADGNVQFLYSIDEVNQSFPVNPKLVTSGDNFKLPGGQRGRVFDFTLSAWAPIDYVGLGGSAHDFA